MHSFKRILVPVDFSSCSLLALERAWQLAQLFDATIDVLHVYQSPPLVGPEVMVGFTVSAPRQSLEEAVRSAAESGLAQFVERARLNGIRIASAQAVYGDTPTTILRTAEDGDYDLIAVGTHGRTALSRLLLGSVAEKVVRRSTRPVLTVRELPAQAAA